MQNCFERFKKDGVDGKREVDSHIDKYKKVYIDKYVLNNNFLQY